MSYGLLQWAASGNLEWVRLVVENGADIEETDEEGKTALLWGSLKGHFVIVVYLVEHGANVTHTDSEGRTALHGACTYGDLSCVTYLLEHGARITDRDHEGKTALLDAALWGSLELLQFLLSSEGGASITETDDWGNNALLLAAGYDCQPIMVQWLLEYGGAQITDTDNEGASVWTVELNLDKSLGNSLQVMLISAYAKDDNGEYVSIDGDYTQTEDTLEMTAMLRVMLLHGAPPESLTKELAPPFQRTVQDGGRLRARLPAYMAQRRALLDAHCPLLPPLRNLVHGYEEPTTTDELWATGLGSPRQRAKRSRSERGQSTD
jgi:hypothetical protein